MINFIAENLYDSAEIMKELEKVSEGKIESIEDLTKSTNRDDTFCYKFYIKRSEFSIDEVDINDEEKINELLDDATDYIKSLVETLDIDYTLSRSYAYKYDESLDAVIGLTLIMYIETARKRIDSLFDKIIRYNL